MSLRGWPTAADDEPHHEVMGRGTQPVLDGIGMPYTVLGASLAALGDALDRAERLYRQRHGFVVLVPRDTVASGRATGTDCVRPLRRREAVSMVARHIRDALVFTTTGMISRELFGVMDAPGHFYMQGSMGHAIGLGLGTALARGDQRVIVVDGDGAALMHLGALALVGDRQPSNLTHIILDNGVYDSTGGQLTRCRPVPWDQLALALGYRTGAVCDTADGLDRRLKELAGLPGPHLVGVRLAAEAAEGSTPPRVTSTYRNPDIRARFQAHAAPRLTRPSSAGR
jgi:phosphonopyruvate decarboxylase